MIVLVGLAKHAITVMYGREDLRDQCMPLLHHDGIEQGLGAGLEREGTWLSVRVMVVQCG